MDELDDEIARLERRLAELHRLRKRPVWQPGQSFEIDAPDENDVEDQLSLAAAPDIVHMILEALCVSVFLKYSDNVPGKGRLFTYINEKARSRLSWSPEEVASRYDSEAFVGGYDSELYQIMLNQETCTLAGGGSRETQLEWQPGEDFWRRSKTIEVPIFRRGHRNKGPVGFCAIAEEVEFEMFPFIHSWLRQTFNHEFWNVCAEVEADVDKGIAFIHKLQAAGIGTPAAADLFTAEAPSVLRDLDESIRNLQVYGLASQEIYDAFSPENYKEVQSISDVRKSIKYIFDNAPYAVPIEIADGVHQEKIRRAAAIKGVLVALIGNARKHADKDDHGKKEVRLSVESNDGMLIWKVRNRCKVLNGSLKLRSFVERRTEGTAKGLTGVIIGEILSRAFPADAWRDMLEFPDAITDGWVTVTLRCPSTGRGQ